MDKAADNCGVSNEELTDADLERIRKEANAPAEDDPEWTVVDGPGW